MAGGGREDDGLPPPHNMATVFLIWHVADMKATGCHRMLGMLSIFSTLSIFSITRVICILTGGGTGGDDSGARARQHARAEGRGAAVRV